MEFKGIGKKWKAIGNEIWNSDGQPIIIGLAYPHNPSNVCLEKQRANALLISKSPEMLYMLIELRDSILSGDNIRMLASSQKAKELIKESTELN